MVQMAAKIEQLEARNKTLASELRNATKMRDHFLFQSDELAVRLREAEKGVVVIEALRAALA